MQLMAKSLAALLAMVLVTGCGSERPSDGNGAGSTDGDAQPDAVPLPRTLAWTAYNLGTTGYNQSVAIGNVLRNRYGVTLRVIPGQNDISRLLPLKTGRAQFSANGVATYFAQEGVFQFAHPDWGPQPLRMLMTSNGLSNLAVAVAADTGVLRIEDLRGRRVGWVRAAPALNVSTQAVLACGGLDWDDVVRVDFPGYEAMWTGIINGEIDAAFASTVSGTTRRLEASPRGIHWLSMPHDDEACWERVLSVAPYYTRHTATRGAGIDDAATHEGGTYPYPILITPAAQDESLVYWLTRAIHENYAAFKDADPGAIGWGLDYQIFDWVVPYHDGAVRYWREIGVWTDALEDHNLRLIERQLLLADAWTELESRGIGDATAFREQWYRLRAERLEASGFDAVWRDPAAVPPADAASD
jgi:uncharacterized protein